MRAHSVGSGSQPISTFECHHDIPHRPPVGPPTHPPRSCHSTLPPIDVLLGVTLARPIIRPSGALPA
eukprot:2608872-Alexandrium_andersonii.AAC.1